MSSEHQKSRAKRTIKQIPIWLLITVLLITASPAEAQEPGKVPRIAYLGGASPSAIAYRTEAFRQRLRELGYVEGKNIIIEFRYAEEKLDASRRSRLS